MREKIQKKSALFVSCGGFSLVVGVITCKLIQSTVYNYTKQKRIEFDSGEFAHCWNAYFGDGMQFVVTEEYFY